MLTSWMKINAPVYSKPLASVYSFLNAQANRLFLKIKYLNPLSPTQLFKEGRLILLYIICTLFVHDNFKNSKTNRQNEPKQAAQPAAQKPLKIKEKP